MLSMHLLQSALVLMNTLLVQNVLADPERGDRLTDTDRRGLTPCSGPTSTPTAPSSSTWPAGSSSDSRSHPTSQPLSHSPLLCGWGQLPKERADTKDVAH
jgi:hypothetical protein